MRRKEDQDYALNVKKKVQEQEEIERKKLEEQKAQQLKYKEMLRKQIEETNKKRLYKDVMSVYEKKINGLDLEAYENMDTQLHAKIVGVKDATSVGLTPIKKTPPKLINENNNDYQPNPDNKPMVNPIQYRDSPKPDAPDYELARKINMVDAVYVRNSKGNRGPSIITKSPSKLLEQAIQNMRDPRVEFMRNNTHNRAYGYKPDNDRKQGAMNQSFDIAKMQQGYDRKIDLNRSFAPPPSQPENPLAQGAKAQMSFVQQVNEMDYKPRRIQATPPGERSDMVYNRPKVKYEINDKLKAAGSIRRQFVNYNIITGEDNNIQH